MKEDVSKSLLLQFYGLNEEHTVDKSLSTSKALEIFDGVANVVCSSTDNLFSIEQTDAELVPNHPDNHKQDAQLVNSLCLLTLQEITNDEADKDDNPDLKGTKLAIDIVTESSKEENFDAKVEDSLTKNIAKISETLPKSDATKSIEHHLGRNLSCGPMEAENSCPRQTILSKGNLIPSIFSKFDGTCLNLNNAGISVFPINILDKLQTLQMLYLDSNKLSEIPDEFFTTLTNLKWLDVRNNLLKSIPSSIKNHVNIESVLLQGNSIEQLPLELGLAPNLKNLQLAHNPLVFPPQHILDSDTATLVNFLRQKWNEKHPSQTVALNKFEQGATEKKPTTIICYQSCENVGKAKKLKRGAGSVQNIKSSVRTKAWNYKPSNRCEYAGDTCFEERKSWLCHARKLFGDQARRQVEKLTNKRCLEQWRHDIKRFASMNNEIKNNYTLEVPFALHNESLNRNSNSMEIESFRNFNESLKNLADSFDQLDTEAAPRNITFETAQQILKAKINKIEELRRKLNKLKLHNETNNIIGPYEGPELATKEYVPSPSMII